MAGRNLLGTYMRNRTLHDDRRVEESLQIGLSMGTYRADGGKSIFILLGSGEGGL